MHGLKRAALCFLSSMATLPIAEADTTILERDRSDRQEQADKYVPQTSPAPSDQGETRPDVRPFAPFVLKKVEIEGSSLSEAALGPLTSRFVGKIVDIDTANAMAKDLTSLYANSDIALYSIFVARRDTADGALRIVVVEGRVGQIALKGDLPLRISTFAEEILTPLTLDVPLRRTTSDRAIALLTSVPGLRLQASELFNANERGTVTFAPSLAFREFETGVAITTRGSASLGGTMMQADASINNLLRPGDRTTTTFGTPLDFENFRYYGFAHQTPLGADGLRLSANVGYLVTEPDGIPVEGKATLAGVQLSYPLALSLSRAVTVGIGLDGLDSDNALLGQTVSGDNTRVVRASAQYAEVDGTTRYAASLALSKGINALGARTMTPSLVDIAFFKATAQASYSQLLMTDVSLRLVAGAQYTDDALPGSEQASLGGALFGRAFDAAAATGDSDLAGSAEVAYLLDLPTPFSDGEIYGFADGGHVWRVARTGYPNSDTGLASVGFGARLTVFDYLALGVELAHAIDYPDGAHHDEDWRTIFSFSSRLH